MSGLDLIMDHAEAKQIVQSEGYDAFIRKVDEGFHYGLSSASQYWEKDPKYICKMKGRKGDVIIGWTGTHGT